MENNNNNNIISEGQIFEDDEQKDKLLDNSRSDNRPQWVETEWKRHIHLKDKTSFPRARECLSEQGNKRSEQCVASEWVQQTLRNERMSEQ